MVNIPILDFHAQSSGFLLETVSNAWERINNIERVGQLILGIFNRLASMSMFHSVYSFFQKRHCLGKFHIHRLSFFSPTPVVCTLTLSAQKRRVACLTFSRLRKGIAKRPSRNMIRRHATWITT